MRKMLLAIYGLFKNIKIDWTKWSKRGERGFQFGWRLTILLFVLGTFLFIFRGLRDNGYAIQAFEMPKAMKESGFTGTVVARKLVDELNQLEAFVSSVKEGTISELNNTADKPDLDVEVMGIGLTLNAVTYHLRELLGRPNRSIGGEITDLDNKLSLTLRITNTASQHFSYSYQSGNKEAALQSLIQDAAKTVIGILDPYRIAVYHYKKEETKECLEVIGDVLNTHPEDAAWAYIAWGNLLDREGKWEEAIDKFQIAMELAPELDIPYNNIGWIQFQKGDYEAALATFQKGMKTAKNKGEAWSRVAVCLKQLKRFEESEAAYEKVLKYNPKDLYVYDHLAQLKYQRRDTTGLRALYSRVIKKVSPGSIGYYQVQSSYFSYLNNLDRDEIGVTALEGRFTALQMRVKNAPINLHKVTVHYRNGRPQTVNVRQTVRAGGQTRTLDLNGGKRVITKIVFWYDTKNLAARRGKIELWGKH